MLPKIFEDARWVLERLETAGYEAYFVGGCVRDLKLKREINDVDITTSATPQEVKKIFKKTIDVGIEHGTVLVLGPKENYEVTTFRTEGEYSDFRRPNEVAFVRDLKEDLQRRDFTINAMALDAEGTIIDLFGGTQDLANHLLRTVGVASERFNEDALRIMRLCRFVSQLEFDVEPATLEAAKTLSVNLEHVSIERKLVEIEKLLLGADRNKGLQTLIETEAINYCPNFEQLIINKIYELPEEHFESNVQAWLVILFISEIKEINKFLKPWKTSNKIINSVRNLTRALTIRLERDYTKFELYKLGIENALIVERTLKYFGVAAKFDELAQTWDGLPIYERTDIKIDGNILMEALDKKGGPWLAETLNIIEGKIISNETINSQIELINLAKEIN